MLDFQIADTACPIPSINNKSQWGATTIAAKGISEVCNNRETGNQQRVLSSCAATMLWRGKKRKVSTLLRGYAGGVNMIFGIRIGEKFDKYGRSKNIFTL